MLTDPANALREEGVIDERESCIDATCAFAKDGGGEIGPTQRRKGVRSNRKKRKTQESRQLRRYA